MKWIFAVFLMMLTMDSSPAGIQALPCVMSTDTMPESWKPTDKQQRTLRTEPWSLSEADEATFAIRTGVDEMLNLFERTPTAPQELWEDSVAALIEVTYSGANTPELDTKARDGARRNLSALMQPYLARSAASAVCDEYELVLPLAIYAHTRLQEDDHRIAKMAQLANAAYKDCGTLTDAMGIDYKDKFATGKASLDDAFDMVIWSLLFIEGQLAPALEMPAESRDFPARLWAFLQDYPLPAAESYKEGAFDEEFIEVAYLATHIAYIPTGNHRYPIYVADSPALFDFHRENFYDVLEMGELDLVAEFVDSLRQYGCTPENDRQVLDGTRYLLGLFHAGGDQWMTYREQDETEQDVETYDLVHKAWTGVLGIREREIWPPDPGTYGGVVREWLPSPRYSPANPANPH